MKWLLNSIKYYHPHFVYTFFKDFFKDILTKNLLKLFKDFLEEYKQFIYKYNIKEII